ncbi:MAG: hypothetical protein VYA84_18490 [Planctomycetota bacterium]|nr:hypothetical protein [Planctomycetota bacterium]
MKVGSVPRGGRLSHESPAEPAELARFSEKIDYEIGFDCETGIGCSFWPMVDELIPAESIHVGPRLRSMLESGVLGDTL